MHVFIANASKHAHRHVFSTYFLNWRCAEIWPKIFIKIQAI